MKRTISFFLLVSLIISTLSGTVIVYASGSQNEPAENTIGTNYYIDAVTGSDDNAGTSPDAAWKTLTKATNTTFQPGDQILLKSGCVWNGQQFWPKGSGTAEAVIKIDKYGGDEKPIINGMGIDWGYTYCGALHLRNQEYWEIRNLEITNDDDFDVDIDLSRAQGDNSWRDREKTRNGILLIVDGDQLAPDADGIMDHIYIEHCYIHDVDGPNDWNDEFTGGIIFNVVGSAIRPSTSFRDLRITYNTIKKVDLLAITGFVTTTSTAYQTEIDENDLWMRDIYIGHNYMEDIGQGAIDLCDAKNALVEYNVVDGFLRRYPSFRPTVALYPWKCENAIFQYNEVFNGPSTNADGSPYDMDSGLVNVVYQFNYSHNNPCGWMLYMGKNDNDIIRYNISDDGGDFIIKYFLTACTSPTYFLNNVIIYDGARTKFMHRDPFKSQTYFYNNVFYNKSTTTTTTWHDTARYQSNLGEVTFSNNCFYEASGIHSQYEPADPNKITSNPMLLSPGQPPVRNEAGLLSGASIWEGYKLTEASPLIDAGIYVPEMGTQDFFGNSLYYGNAPDIGVHEKQRGTFVAVPTNLALGQTITASSAHPSLPATNAIDGINNEKSRWAAANDTLPIWLELDFGDPVTFNKITLTENIVSRWASARIAKFELQIPTESGYTQIYEYAGTIGDNFACSFAETTASNLRLVITELRADTTLHGGRAKEPSIREWGVYLDPFVNYDLNLALGCPATSDNSHSACPASAINDGSKDQISRWAAANSTLPIWVDIDLGTVKTFDTLILTENIVPQWASARIASFDLQIWDGNDYRTVFTYDGIVGENHTFSFEAISAQNVRLLITGLRADTTKNGNQATDPSIRELELYYRNVSKPINIALSKPATASNSHPACPVSDINDGNPSESSRWAASDSTLPAWLEIDLGTPTRVNTLVLSENIVPEWATARISEFALQKWNGSAFETVFTFQGTIGDEHIFKFDTIESEKVRILISALRPDTSINSAGQTDPSLTEIELYCY